MEYTPKKKTFYIYNEKTKQYSSEIEIFDNFREPNIFYPPPNVTDIKPPSFSDEQECFFIAEQEVWEIRDKQEEAKEDDIQKNEYGVALQVIEDGVLVDRSLEYIEKETQEVLNKEKEYNINLCKSLLAKSNYIFTSDNKGKYTSEQIEELENWRSQLRKLIETAEENENLVVPEKPAWFELGL